MTRLLPLDMVYRCCSTRFAMEDRRQVLEILSFADRECRGSGHSQLCLLSRSTPSDHFLPSSEIIRVRVVVSTHNFAIFVVRGEREWGVAATVARFFILYPRSDLLAIALST
jgi:hypothetical protein